MLRISHFEPLLIFASFHKTTARGIIICSPWYRTASPQGGWLHQASHHGHSVITESSLKREGGSQAASKAGFSCLVASRASRLGYMASWHTALFAGCLSACKAQAIQITDLLQDLECTSEPEPLDLSDRLTLLNTLFQAVFVIDILKSLQGLQNNYKTFSKTKFNAHWPCKAGMLTADDLLMPPAERPLTRSATQAAAATELSFGTSEPPCMPLTDKESISIVVILL